MPTKPRLVISGVDDFDEDSRQVLRMMAEGDMAAYDTKYHGSPSWVAYWHANGESFMARVLTIIRNYETLRGTAHTRKRKLRITRVRKGSR